MHLLLIAWGFHVRAGVTPGCSDALQSGELFLLFLPSVEQFLQHPSLTSYPNVAAPQSWLW